METAAVSSVSEGITALQLIKDRHGDLPMLNEEGGPFQFTTIIWGEEDRRAAGGELQDGVCIDGVGVVRNFNHGGNDPSDKIGVHIAIIQDLAAKLTEAQADHAALETMLTTIERETDKCKYEIEDLSSRFAKLWFSSQLGNKACVPLRQLAYSLNKDFWNLRLRLRMAIQAGKLPAIKKNERYYATVETLTEYFRENTRNERSMLSGGTEPAV